MLTPGGIVGAFVNGIIIGAVAFKVGTLRGERRGRLLGLHRSIRLVDADRKTAFAGREETVNAVELPGLDRAIRVLVDAAQQEQPP